MPEFRSRPMQCFSLIFTSAIWTFLVEKTNEFAHHKLERYTKRSSLYRNWKPITLTEMKAFVGIILNMGIIQLQNLRDYWSTSNVCNIPLFQKVFSQNRFFQIFGMLHVGEITSKGKCKIEPLLIL